MVNGKPLFTGMNEKDQLQKIFKLLGSPTKESAPTMVDNPDLKKLEMPLFEGKKISMLCPRLDPVGCELLEKMLVIDPSKRISADDILKHPWLRDVPTTLLSK